MSDGYSIVIDVENLLKYYEGTWEELAKPRFANGLRTSVLYAAGNGLRKLIRMNYGTVLGKQTGNLYRDVRVRPLKDRTGVSIYSSAKNKEGRRYGFILGHGATVLPRDPDGLLYIVNKEGKITATAKQVTILPREFMKMPAQSYLGSQACREAMDKAAQKYIAMIIKKLEAFYNK